MKKRGGSAAIVLSILLATSLFSGCTRKDDSAGKITIRTYHPDDIKSLDPALAYDEISWDVVPQIYETLYQYHYLSPTYQLTPLLAADFPRVSADQLTVTIPLRNDVRFQDDACFPLGKGRSVTAHDFIYAWKRLAQPKLHSGGWWIFDGKVVGLNEFQKTLASAKDSKALQTAMETPVEGLTALDDFTLQIRLTQPYPQLMQILAMPFTSAVPKEAVQKYADPSGALLERAVGSGAFTLKSWDRNRRIVLERNPNFHVEFYPAFAAEEYRKQGLLVDAGKQLPFLERVEIYAIKEAQPAWLKFQKGELDVALIPKDSFSQAVQQKTNLSPELAAKGIRLSIAPTLKTYFPAFNMKDSLLGKNKLLRQALASAIDRDAWIETFTNGRGQKQLTVLPPNIPDRPTSPRIKYDFNLARAKELLAQAGYPGGKGLPAIKFDLRGADTVSRQMGDFFSQQLARIGVKLDVIPNPLPAYLDKAKSGRFQFFLGGWIMDYPDAENSYQLLYGPNHSPGPNESNFDHPEMNALYEKMARLKPGKERAEIIAKMDEIFQEEVPWILGYYYTEYRLSQPWVKNFRPSEIILNRYKYFRVDEATRKRYRESAN